MANKPDVWIKGGLIEAKHFRAIGEALWLYLYIQQQVDFESGETTKYSHVTAAAAYGVNERTIRRWFETLLEGGYIEAKRGRHFSRVKITKYIPVKNRIRGNKKQQKRDDLERTDLSVIDSRTDKSVNQERTNLSGRTDKSVNQERTNLSEPYHITTDLTTSFTKEDCDASASRVHEPTQPAGKELSGEIYRYVKTLEETIGYEYTDRKVAYKQAKAAILSKPQITCEELQECAVWMLETNEFWSNTVLNVVSIVKQLGLFRKKKAEGWLPGQKGSNNGRADSRPDSGAPRNHTARDAGADPNITTSRHVADDWEYERSLMRDRTPRS